MTWKYLPHYWPFVRGIRQLTIPMSSNAEIWWCICWLQADRAFGQMAEWLVKNDASVNSLWPCQAIWRDRFGSTLTCCLTAPNHYLNQCWLLVDETMLHSPERNLAVSAQATVMYNEFEHCTFKIIVTSSKYQWIRRSTDRIGLKTISAHIEYNTLNQCI